MFHFGHVAYGFGLGYQDHFAANISASNISEAIDLQKHDFVFLWVCGSAQNNTSNGLAAAWTQRTTLSPDGYGDPDHEDQVYIGFWGFSPQINNHTAFEEDETGPLQYWIERFYYYALTEPRSVKDALDQASDDLWGKTFDQSILRKEPYYKAWWPGIWNGTHWVNRGYWEGKMNVFGDAEMFVFQPTMTVSASAGGITTPSGTRRYTYGHSEYVIAQTVNPLYHFSHWELNGAYYSGSQSIWIDVNDNYNLQAIFTEPMYLLAIYGGAGGTTDPEPGPYSFPVGTYVNVTAIPDGVNEFDYWILQGNVYYPNPITIQMLGNYDLQPHFIQKYCLTIQGSYGGHTVPSAGKHYYTQGTNVQVTAYLDYPEYFYWSHWNLDGEYYSSNSTVTVTMNSNHTLSPIFTYSPPPVYHDLTLEYFAFYWGQWIYMAGSTSSLPEDNYILTVPSTVYGLDFVCWYYDGAYRDYGQTSITIFLGEDRYFAAIYVPS